MYEDSCPILLLAEIVSLSAISHSSQTGVSRPPCFADPLQSWLSFCTHAPDGPRILRVLQRSRTQGYMLFFVFLNFFYFKELVRGIIWAAKSKICRAGPGRLGTQAGVDGASWGSVFSSWETRFCSSGLHLIGGAPPPPRLIDGKLCKSTDVGVPHINKIPSQPHLSYCWMK